MLRYQALQEVIGTERQGHVHRVWPDQQRVGLDDQVNGVAPLELCFLPGERPLAFLHPLAVEVLHEGLPLRHVNARQGDEGIVTGEGGRDPRDKLVGGIPRKGRFAQYEHARGHGWGL